jgi:S-formylglutathione hydrolase FrmB
VFVQGPVSWRVDHDKGHFVGGVGCFGVALFVEHFFGVAAMMGILVNRLGILVWGGRGRYLVEKGDKKKKKLTRDRL